MRSLPDDASILELCPTARRRLRAHLKSYAGFAPAGVDHELWRKFASGTETRMDLPTLRVIRSSYPNIWPMLGLA